MTPDVSVVMPVYNSMPFLGASVESILDQTFRNFELILIDDGSQDGSTTLIKEYAKKDGRIRVLANSENLGINFSLNLGIREANAKYIARMDADDISMPLRLEKQLAFLEEHPEIGLLGSAATVINAEGQPLEQMDFPASDILLRWALCFSSPFIHPTVVMRREVLLQLGSYRSIYPLSEDYDLWARMAKVTKLANLQESLLLLRKHSANVSLLKRNQQMQDGAAISQKLFLEQTGIILQVTPLELGWTHRRASIEELDKVSKAIKILYNRIRILPLSIEELKSLRREAAIRQASLLQNCAPGLFLLKILSTSLHYDPSAIIQILRSGIQRMSHRD